MKLLAALALAALALVAVPVPAHAAATARHHRPAPHVRWVPLPVPHGGTYPLPPVPRYLLAVAR